MIIASRASRIRPVARVGNSQRPMTTPTGKSRKPTSANDGNGVSRPAISS